MSGYFWHRGLEPLESIPQAWVEAKGAKRAVDLAAKPVRQFSLEGNFIAEYPSINKAARAVGVQPVSIRQVLKGHQTQTHGYVWEFAEASGDANEKRQ